MKKRLITHMKWLMLFSLLTSSLYAAADSIKSINGPATITKGEEVSITVDYVASEERTLAIYFQSTTSAYKYFYKRITVDVGDELETVTFTVPDDIDTNKTYKYGTYISPKGKYWRDNLGYASQKGVKVESDTVANDTVKSISGPATITIGEAVTLTVDYVASEDRTLAVYLKATTGTKKNYFYKRITVHAGDELEQVTFTVPDNAPTDATYKYGTYISPKGKYYKDNLGTAYQQGVKVQNADTQEPLTKEALKALISNWLTQSSQRDFRGGGEEQALIELINNANVSEITDMSYLFEYCEDRTYTSMLGDLGGLDLTNWDVSSVVNMEGMFACPNVNTSYHAATFNRITADISTWNVSNVTNMKKMFYGSYRNIDISAWDVSNVMDMSDMFSVTLRFNADISNWDVSSVTNMSSMFSAAHTFNQSIGNWNVSNVTDMTSMFQASIQFNQDIRGWDVSKVTYMDRMFAVHSERSDTFPLRFNQDISNWDVFSVVSHEDFVNKTAFGQNYALEDKHNPFK